MSRLLNYAEVDYDFCGNRFGDAYDAADRIFLFEDDLTDSSGNGNNATGVGSITYIDSDGGRRAVSTAPNSVRVNTGAVVDSGFAVNGFTILARLSLTIAQLSGAQFGDHRSSGNLSIFCSGYAFDTSEAVIGAVTLTADDMNLAENEYVVCGVRYTPIDGSSALYEFIQEGEVVDSAIAGVYVATSGQIFLDCNSGYGSSSRRANYDSFWLYQKPISDEKISLLTQTGAMGCLAQGPVGTECYNTRNTCQYVPGFDKTTKVLRFAMPTNYLPKNIDAIPSVSGINTAPAVIRPGEDLGQRASVSVAFNDHPHHDRGLDPYVATRPYNPIKQGTYWGKWRARNPYFQSRGLRIIKGYLGQSLDEMTTRHYLMETISGPDASGRFTITAKDVLKLADDDRAQAPVASNGRLDGDIDESATSFTIQPAGIGSEYPSSGKIVIGSELMTFTRSGDNFTVVRAQSGTKVDTHSDDAAVQVVLEYDSKTPSFIINDLLTNYASVPAEFIPLDDWTFEDDTYLSRAYTVEIVEPTAVKDLIGGLCRTGGIYLWWDEISQLVQFKGIREPSFSLIELNDDADFLESSMRIKEQPRTRISQIWVYYGVIDPTEDLDESTNYHGLYVLVDADAESADQYGQPNIEKIYGRWISQFNRPAAESLAQRRLSRYRDPPRHISFDLTFNSKKIDIGQIFWTNTRLIQSVSGENDPGRYLAVSYEQSESKINVSGEEFNYQPLDDGGVKRVIVDNNTLNLNLRSAFDDIYSSVSSGDEIELTIESGAFVGSASSSTPALDIGDWPDGVIITVIVNGRIQGKGGDGGRGSPLRS